MDKKEFIQEYVLRHADNSQNVINTAESLADELCSRNIINDTDNDILSMRIDRSRFNGRVINLFNKFDINTVGDLVKFGRSNMMKKSGIGKVSIIETDEYLESIGINW